MEFAALRRVDRAGDIAFEDGELLRADGIRRRDGVEQGLGVRMDRVVEDLVGLRQLDHDDWDGFDQGPQELDASLRDLGCCGDQSRHGGPDDLRQGVHQRVDDDRQGVHQCHQELDAGVNDLRDGRDQELHDGADDLRQCFDQYGKRRKDALSQTEDQLQRAVEDCGQLVQE